VLPYVPRGAQVGAKAYLNSTSSTATKRNEVDGLIVRRSRSV
jgi:hypothetical protein